MTSKQSMWCWLRWFAVRLCRFCRFRDCYPERLKYSCWLLLHWRMLRKRMMILQGGTTNRIGFSRYHWWLLGWCSYRQTHRYRISYLGSRECSELSCKDMSKLQCPWRCCLGINGDTCCSLRSSLERMNCNSLYHLDMECIWSSHRDLLAVLWNLEEFIELC